MSCGAGHLDTPGFQLSQLAIAAMVARFVDDVAGSGEVLAGGRRVAFGEVEAGVAEVGVGLVETEAAAGGEGEGGVEVAAGGGDVASVAVERGAGEEAKGEVVLPAGATEAVDGLLKMRGGRGLMEPELFRAATSWRARYSAPQNSGEGCRYGACSGAVAVSSPWMGHAHHFLTRLDRVSLPHAELALGFYNDVPLLQFILQSVRLPEGAPRVAISLDHPDNGPFLVVTREGRFVTCLGEGMSAGELPVITRGQLDGVAAKALVLRERMAEAQRLAGAKGGVGKLLQRVHDAADELSREEILAISGLQPLYAFEFFQCLFAVASDLKSARDIFLLDLRRTDRLRPQYHAALRSYWNGFWSLGHFSVLATLDGWGPLEKASDALVDAAPRVPISWLTVREGISSNALRGAWAAGRLGKPLLPGYKQRYREANSPLSIIDSCLGLGAIALRHVKLSAEVSKLLSTGPSIHPESLMGQVVHGLSRIARRIVDSDGVTAADVLAGQCQIGAMTWMEATKHLPPGAPYRFERREDVPVDLALCAAVNAPFNFLSDPDSGFEMFAALPWVARATPEQLYLPRAAIRAMARPWVPEDTLLLLRAHRDNPVHLAKRRPVRSSGPARQDPCPCGSGKKYKRCCEVEKQG